MATGSHRARHGETSRRGEDGNHQATGARPTTATRHTRQPGGRHDPAKKEEIGCHRGQAGTARLIGS